MILDNKKMALLSLVAIFLITIDRWFKAVAVNLFDPNHYLPLTSWLRLSLSWNKNIAFSLPASGLILKIIIIILIIIFITIYLYWRKKNRLIEASWMLWIIFGSISNLYDRFKYEAVVDYIDLQYFTIFNLADILICLGATGLIWFNLKNKPQHNQINNTKQ